MLIYTAFTIILVCIYIQYESIERHNTKHTNAIEYIEKLMYHRRDMDSITLANAMAHLNNLERIESRKLKSIWSSLNETIQSLNTTLHEDIERASCLFYIQNFGNKIPTVTNFMQHNPPSSQYVYRLNHRLELGAVPTICHKYLKWDVDIAPPIPMCKLSKTTPTASFCQT